MRIEKDFLGEKEIPANSLFGIHSLRAKENFPNESIFYLEWFKALGITKKACYLTYKNFKNAVSQKYNLKDIFIDFFDDNIIENLILAAEEISEGKHFENFIVPAIQGGAGTSINMNINEIIANIALLKSEKNPGEYSFIDPIEHANIFQSTNDVIPTSLKISILQLLEILEEEINKLRSSVEQKENEYRNTLRIAYTQLQEAVPSSYGKLFSTYNEALSRDWWRVSKCFERIKTVNLGGSAIGTSIAVPTYFTVEVIKQLQLLTKLPVTSSENLCDATNNLDSYVEIHAILKSHAVNLEKIVSDLRLLSSSILGNRELSIPDKQTGSSIMPGKINPVIPEYVISISHKIYSNDMLISSLSAQGVLDLNAYLPIIGNSIIESLKLLISANITLRENLIKEIYIDSKISEKKLFKSPAITTALNPYIGYKKASILANEMKNKNCDIFEANKKLRIIDEEKLIQILKPENLLKQGFSVKDIEK
jgi:aspartate ammonia-lyase